MPGLLRGIAKTAVVAGTATAVSNNVSRRQATRQANKEAEQAQQQDAAAQDTQSQDDVYAELEKLGQLKNDGILTQAEFDLRKHQLLGM
ncbi:MAG: SHOCT domain-containing protein [Candidatus Saccharimonadales bacterium]